MRLRKRKRVTEPPPEPEDSPELCTLCLFPFSKSYTCPSCANVQCQSCMRQTVTMSSVRNQQCPHCDVMMSRADMVRAVGRCFFDTTVRNKHKALFIKQEADGMKQAQVRLDSQKERKNKIADLQDCLRLHQERKMALKAEMSTITADIGIIRRNIHVHQMSKHGGVALMHEPDLVPCSSCPAFMKRSTMTCTACGSAACPKCWVSLVSAPDGLSAVPHRGNPTTREAHLCDPDAVKSVQVVETSSRGCPGCGTPVARSQGCDHMWSPCCQVTWNWHTGVIKKRGEDQGQPAFHRWERSQGQRTSAFVQLQQILDRLGDIGSNQEESWLMRATVGRDCSQYVAVPIFLCIYGVKLGDTELVFRQAKDRLFARRLQDKLPEATFETRLWRQQERRVFHQQQADALIAFTSFCQQRLDRKHGSSLVVDMEHARRAYNRNIQEISLGFNKIVPIVTKQWLVSHRKHTLANGPFIG